MLVVQLDFFSQIKKTCQDTALQCFDSSIPLNGTFLSGFGPPSYLQVGAIAMFLVRHFKPVLSELRMYEE